MKETLGEDFLLEGTYEVHEKVQEDFFQESVQDSPKIFFLCEIAEQISIS